MPPPSNTSWFSRSFWEDDDDHHSNEETIRVFEQSSTLKELDSELKSMGMSMRGVHGKHTEGEAKFTVTHSLYVADRTCLSFSKKSRELSSSRATFLTKSVTENFFAASLLSLFWRRGCVSLFHLGFCIRFLTINPQQRRQLSRFWAAKPFQREDARTSSSFEYTTCSFSSHFAKRL